LLLSFLTVFTLVSCSDTEGNEAALDLPTKNLNVYNWGEYISDEDDEDCGLFDTNAAFEEYFNTYLAQEFGYYVKVNYTTYATNEDMYAKITNSAVAYDIIIPSDYMIEKLVRENLLLPIDKSKLTNYSNISENFKGLYYDKNDEFSVPYSYGMVGIIYNREFVKEEDILNKSWSLLWNADYKGKILQFNNPRDAFATAMYWKGIDINSKNTADWDTTLALLKEQKGILQGYVNDEIFNKMQGASAYIAPYFAGDFLTMSSENEDLRFYYPSEGTNYFVDAMCIPETSKNPDLAHAYIDYMISEEAATANALYIGYASPNDAVTGSDYYKEMLSENYDTDDVSAWDILYGESKDSANVSYPYNPAYEDFYKDGEINIQSYVNALWEELKTENATEPWIHVSSGIIVGALIAFWAYNSYITKKRSRHYRYRDRQKNKRKT
jgi:spermidine/putrescine transport system substrate-binding protein